MAQWIVVHSLKSFSEHPDMIGVVSAKGNPEPIYRPFTRIRRDDELAYYAIRDSVIVGTFRVVSDMEYMDDSIWGPSCTYRITSELLPPSGKVLDFKKLVLDPRTKFDLFQNKRNWHTYLRGHACRPLSVQDFEVIKRSLHDEGLLIPLPEVKPP